MKTSESLKTYIARGGFYEAVVEEGADMIIIVDYQGTMLYLNPSSKETLGYRPKELINKNFFDYLHPEQTDTLKNDFKNISKRNFSYNIEFRFRQADGQYKYLEFNSINLYHKEKLKGLILDCRDISQRKKVAIELVKAQKAKEQFLANMSHEIRTPINGIAGMVNLLTESNIGTEQLKYLKAIKSSADYLKVIINDILDFAAIESGKLSFENVGFTPETQVKTIVDSFTYIAKEKGVEIRYNINIDPQKVFLGDPIRLNQVLVNLINNAIKFTDKGTITIDVAIEKVEGSNSFIEFSVSDTGIGIPKSRINKIFEAFTQADESVTRKFGGTGLGLSICKQLVELQNGNISVKSKENVGSTFSFIIPYKEGEKSNLISVSIPKQSKITDLPKFSNYSVLLVEDNEINSLYASNLIKKWNCDIDDAENGKKALELYMKNHYDIILMDLQMPIMDGFEATKIIRNKFPDGKNEIPIIALTANAIKGDNEKCFEVGMNDYLSKPFLPEQLHHILAKYYSGELDLNQDTSPEEGYEDTQGKYTDLSYLRSISDNDENFMMEMIETFVDKTPKIIEEMKLSAKNEDWAKLGSLAHKLKPSISFMGLHDLSELIKEIEEKAITNSYTDTISSALERFTPNCEKAITELQHRIINKDLT